MREKLRRIVEGTDTVWGRIFDISILVLIVISIISFTVDSLPSIPPNTHAFFHKVELLSFWVFSLEYLLRIYVARKPLSYMLSFYGIIDLLAIVPYYVTGIKFDLRALRVFRLLRIFQMLHLMKYNNAIHRFRVAANLVKEEIVLYLLVSGIFIYLSSVGIYYFEHDVQPAAFASIFDSIWWAVVTLTTVGYGDIYPITIGGKVFTTFILIIGVGIVTIPAGLIASSLNKARAIVDGEDGDVE